MTPDEVQRWLDAYLDAWKTYDGPAIEALFSEDVAYRYHPYDDPITGRDAVVASWLGDGQHAGASSPAARGQRRHLLRPRRRPRPPPGQDDRDPRVRLAGARARAEPPRLQA